MMSDLTSDVVRVHPFFSGMKSKHLGIFLESATRARFAPEEMLFREGEPANQFYLIQKGRIVLEAREPRRTPAVIQTLGCGDVLGWSWLFPPFTWHFSARAVEPASAIVLNAGHLLAAADADHDFGYELMKRVTRLVIHRLQITRERIVARQSVLPELSATPNSLVR